MDQQAIQSIVEEVVSRLTGVFKRNHTVPMAVSARHCHLSKSDLETLFGEGYELTKKADLSQPGQFAANESITIVGPRGSIEKVRILGPARNMTQVEVSQTDSVKLGVKPPLRESGDILGSAPVTLVGPKGSLYLKEGLIIAQAHIHMTPDDALLFGVENGEYVNVEVDGERPVTLGKVLIRVSPRYKLEMHVDTDEANAGFITGKTTGKLVKYEESKCDPKANSSETFSVNQNVSVSTVATTVSSVKKKKLLTQRDVQTCGDVEIVVDQSTIITPLARDTAREMGKIIKVIESKDAKR